MKIQPQRFILSQVAIFLMIILGYPCSAQKTASVSNDRGNILFQGISNYISVVVEGISCDSIIVTIDNGVITGKGCSYIVQVSNKPTSTVFVKYLSKGDTINAYASKFLVKPIPTPSIAIAGKFNVDSISIEKITNAPFLTAAILDFDFDLRYDIKKFSSIIIRADSCAYSGVNARYKLSDETLAFLTGCETGDKLIIFSVDLYGPLGKIKVAPVEYILKR